MFLLKGQEGNIKISKSRIKDPPPSLPTPMDTNNTELEFE